MSPNRTIMIVLSYLWLLAIIPLIVEKDDKEVQWHAKHGLVLLVAEVIFWVAIGIVGFVVTHIFAPLGCILLVLECIVGLGILLVHVLCIVKGVNGQRFLVPGLSQYADRF